MTTIGTKQITTQAMTLAAVSSASPERNDADAGAAAADSRTVPARRAAAHRALGKPRRTTLPPLENNDRRRLLRGHFLPAGTGIEAGHLRADLGRGLAEIFLEHLAVVTHDERHHATLAVLRGIRDHREAGDHATVDDVAVRTAGRALALARKNPEVIAAIRVARLVPLEIRRALRHQWPEGTFFLALCRVGRPV